MIEFLFGLVLGLVVGACAGVLAISLAIVASQSDKHAHKLDAEFLADFGTDD